MSQSVTGSDYCTCELVASTSAGATTLLVSTPTEAFPTFDADNTYFYMTIVDEASYAIDANPPVQREIVKVTAYSTVSTGYSLTVVRGITTTAQIWASGSICEIRPCAQWFQDLKGGNASAWGITDGITTVSDVTSLFADGGVVTDYGGGSAGLTTAPPGASYLTLGTNATLTSERVLTAGTNVTFVDGGAGSTLTINASSGSTASTLQSQEFTSSGTFTPASGVTAVWVSMIGGGGAGGGSNSAAGSGAGGGGSGEQVQNFLVPVSGAVTVTIGAAGVASNGAGGGDGGDTSFGNFVARGGKGGTIGNASGTNGVGGAGGGAGAGAGGARGNPGSVGSIGVASSPTGFGGGGGGGGSVSTSGAGGAGAASVGIAGGAGGAAASSQAGGGGGASTPWGAGGTGGAGGASGSAPSSTNYGAGGGGGGGSATTTIGGNGVKGYCLVSWVSA